MVCFECGSVDQYEFKKVIRKYEGEGYSFNLCVTVPFCKKCGAPIANEEIENDIAKKANEKIRECRGIIQRDEIVAILNNYNVSQKYLSKLLGWGEITLTRYISGGYTPNAANSAKLKAIRNPYVLQKIMDDKIEETNGEVAKEPAFQKLQSSVNLRIERLENQDGKIYLIINWFLSQSSEDNPLTHLALQKLLYFSQCWNRILNQKWLFDNECEAWAHGAVYRDVYNVFKKFKYKPLPRLNKKIYVEEGELQVLECVKRYYFDVYNARTLEDICHLEEPYRLARRGYQEGENCEEIIKKESMVAYYQKIAEKYDITRENTQNMKKYLYDLLA